MEQNIHDDKLDDYVRKSFEDHEEEPPADMWSRVEGDLLPPAEVSTLRAAYLRYGWQALAAGIILVLFSTLVCEHLYYERKLREMTGKPTKEQEILLESKGIDETTPLEVQSNTNFQSASPISSQSESNTIKSDLVKTKNSRLDATFDNGQKHQQSGVPGRTETSSSRLKSEAQFPQQTNDLKNESAETPTLNSPSTSETPSVHPLREAISAVQNSTNPIKIECLPIQTSLFEHTSPSAPALALIQIKPVHEPSGWYLGVQGSLLASIEKSRTPISRVGRPAFSSTRESADISSIWWLKIGKKLNTRFSLESGVGYQKTVRTATHTPKFRFGDGTHQGSFPARRTFNYDLSTYGGAAEVSLRMEQTNPGSPASDTEPVSLKITTSEQMELLRIPLLAGYRFGTGRLQGKLKAGLLGNFVLKNELDISARVSQNTRFQPVAGSDGYTVRMNQKQFFLGYLLSAGVEFKLNQRFSLVAESALVGDFPRNDRYSRRLPDRFMVGLNVGANYNF